MKKLFKVFCQKLLVGMDTFKNTLLLTADTHASVSAMLGNHFLKVISVFPFNVLL